MRFAPASLHLLLPRPAAPGEPYAVTAFSGHGPGGVATYPLKRFTEHYHNEVALRIAALEPQHYTRLGAALRHVTADLMQQHAAHRLLLVLSDGKPNDFDHYDGRYGVEDVRQAVTEARLQQIHPFCLTIDRQAPTYLPHMFGAHGYGLLAEPAALPRLLLEWIRQLLTHWRPGLAPGAPNIHLDRNGIAHSRPAG
jgi:nitric oxide reductase NorD protein